MMKYRFILSLVILSIPLYSFISRNNHVNSGNLHVEVVGLKNQKGQLGILVFENNDGFPSNHEKAISMVYIPIKMEFVNYTFENLPFGEYAIAVMHDENQNDKLDTNFLGIPKEGTGVSNNIISKLGPPKFKEARFPLNEPDFKTSIKINY